MKQVIEFSENEEVAVSSPMFLKGNYVLIKIGDIELKLDEEQAKLIYEGIEQALWDDSYHADKLINKVEKLEKALEEAIEVLEQNNFDVDKLQYRHAI
jgi:hydrogenase maturation factor